MENWLRTGQLSHDISSTNVVTNNEEKIPENIVAGCSSAENTATKSTRDRKESEGAKFSKKRRYDDSYLSFGFIPVGSTEEPDGLCLICKKILVNSSLAPAKLKRHFVSNHENLKDKDISFFQRHKETYEAAVSNLHKFAKTDNENATEASFRLSYRIARSGNAHTIAENLIKPCMLEAVGCMLGEDAAKKVAAVQCSNNTVSDRIHKISDHIENELIRRLNASDMFAIQLDESTDVAGLSILLVFVRYVFGTSIEENLLLCTPLETHTTGEEIFKVIDCYMNKHNIDWKKCIDVCSDGAAAMVGKIKGTVSKIKNIAPGCKSSHCILHRYALVVKKMPMDLKKVLDETVKIVNYMKSRPLQSRLFKKVCEEMGSQHESLLLHTEIRWLSRGKVLTRLYELRDELKVFQMEQIKSESPTMFDVLHDEQWLMQLAYLAEIFGKVNEITTLLQGKSITIFMARDKLSAFKRKVNFWIACVEKDNIECFPLLYNFLQENALELPNEMRTIIIGHLENLLKSLSDYFPDRDNNIEWVQNPFIIRSQPVMLTVLDYEAFIDLQSSSTLKQRFESISLNEFWVGVRSEYPEVARKAILTLLPFVTTYRCETGFSAYTYTKTKFRSRLDATPDMHIQLSDIIPNFKAIIDKTVKQFHSSH